MKDNSSEIECQLDTVFGSGTPIKFFAKIKIAIMRLASALKRRLYARKILLLPKGEIRLDCAPQAVKSEQVSDPVPDKLESGDWVMILPYENIAATLDNEHCCDGLEFMPGMRKFCGQKTRVLKRAKTIFDSRILKMIRVRESYLLEGVICDGHDSFNMEGCDRACFFFWKKDWLRKSEN